MRLFLEGSGFRRRSTKQLFGEEFKFILNDYPSVCKNAVVDGEVRTVKLRIYKIFHQVRTNNESNMNQYNQQYRYYNDQRSVEQVAPTLTWKEYNIIQELFEDNESG